MLTNVSHVHAFAVARNGREDESSSGEKSFKDAASWGTVAFA